MKNLVPSKLRGPISLETAYEHGKLLEKVFRVKDTGINSKIFHTWKMASFLSTIVMGKWAALSLIEYLWLQTLETMRKFGCSFKLMKAVHEHLFIRAYKDHLAKKTLEGNVRVLTRLSKKRLLNNDENDFLKKCKDELNDPIRMATTDFEITYFYQLVIRCFTNNIEVGIVIFEDGSFTTYESSEFATSNPIDITRPHLLIPISSFIKKFVVDEEKEQFLSSTGLLNEQEFEVVKQIRNKNSRSVTITFNDRDHTIEKIEPEESGLITGAAAKRIMQTIGLKNYSSIELHTRDGHTLSFTTKTKLFMK